VGAPVVGFVDVGHRRGNTAFGHHGVRLAEERLTDNADACALREGLDRGAQSGAARADNQNVVLVDFVFGVHSSRMSLRTPTDSRRI
jgi:hypothetical protein